MRNRYRRLCGNHLRTWRNLRRSGERSTMPLCTRFSRPTVRDESRFVPCKTLCERRRMFDSRQRLRVQVSARLHRQRLQHRHRRVRLVSVPERRNVSGQSRRLPLLVSPRLGRQVVHGLPGRAGGKASRGAPAESRGRCDGRG